jgi:hypothetical protein
MSREDYVPGLSSSLIDFLLSSTHAFFIENAHIMQIEICLAVYERGQVTQRFYRGPGMGHD